MLKVIEKMAIAWDQIRPQTIRRSWRKLIPLAEADNGADQDNLPSNRNLASTFQTLGYKLGEDVHAWLDSDDSEYEHLSDDQIVEQVELLHSFNRRRMIPLILPSPVLSAIPKQ